MQSGENRSKEEKEGDRNPTLVFKEVYIVQARMKPQRGFVSVAQMLAHAEELSARQLVEVLLDDQRERWGRGDRGE